MNYDRNTERLIKLPEALRRTGLGRSTFYERARAGEFRPVSLGNRAVGFVESEIQAWIADRIKSRDALQAGGAVKALAVR